MLLLACRTIVLDLRRAAMLSLAVLLTGMPVFLPSANAADLTEVSKAVVKLFITKQSWNLQQPWTKHGAQQSTCSGFLIPEGILTNGHCVADATYIQMEMPGVADKVDVELVAVNHQVDLALVKPKDKSFSLDARPITFDDLPELREKVVTIGYPSGGRQVSYTEGIVSRIDIMRYAHSGINSVMVQTDAAINPGSSGGPVFSDRTGVSLGVATQKSTAGEGLGYFVPASVVRQFLKDLENDHIEGIPALGVFFQAMENEAIRESLGMKPGESGIRVLNIAKGSSADGVLKINDVLLSVDSHPILNDGRVTFRGDGKIGFSYYIATKQVGDHLPAVVLRDGVKKDVSLILKPHRITLVPQMPQYDKKPDYFTIGGLVFQVVEPRYLYSWGRDWNKNIPIGLRVYLETMVGENELEELIVISNFFESTANKGYSGYAKNIRVARINGEEIRRLDDVSKAFAKRRKSRFHEIELENGVNIVLNREQLKIEDALIRERYNIP